MRVDWRDIFWVSKNERKGILVALGVAIVAVLIIGFYPFERSSFTQVNEAGEADKEAFLQFLASVERTDSLRLKAVKRGEKPLLPTPVLVAFDPNVADSVAFVRLGLKPWVARNILRYRAKGGVFRRPDDLARIYGIEESQFLQLRPYIQIGEAFRPVVRDTVQKVQRDTLTSSRIQKLAKGVLVDLNQADTALLKRVPGIGSRLAWIIVNYRKQLGGYCRVEQLRELKQVPDSLLGWFKVEAVELKQLDINRNSIERLKAHPYLNFYQAKVIVEHRRRLGKLKTLEQLEMYEEFTPADLSRLKPYVRFE